MNSIKCILTMPKEVHHNKFCPINMTGAFRFVSFLRLGFMRMSMLLLLVICLPTWMSPICHRAAVFVSASHRRRQLFYHSHRTAHWP